MLNERLINYIIANAVPEIDGVYHKVKGFMDTLNKYGYETEILTNKCGRKRGIFHLYAQVVKTEAKHIMIRSMHGWLFLFIVPYMIVARMQGKKLIMDIPTPSQAAIYEILNNRNIGKLKRYKHVLYRCLCYPFVSWFAHVIIQNGDESAYFMFGIKNKTLFLGNGIDPDRMRLREKKYNCKSTELKLIGVGDVTVYHGFDRMIKAIGKWNSEVDKPYKVKFHIIGGRSRPTLIAELKRLALNCGVEEYVVFHGTHNQDYIYDYYSSCDLAVGSLCMFRIHLQCSSILKVREYCLAGIPFIAVGQDPDFTGDVPFRIEVSNDEGLDDLLKVFEDFPEKRKLFTDEEIRAYAIQHCSFASKVEKLGFKNWNVKTDIL